MEQFDKINIQALLRMTKEKHLSFHIQKTVYILILVDSWYMGGEDIQISVMKKFK